MSTSTLYHAYNLKGIKYKSTSYVGNKIIFNAEMTDALAKCPKCDFHKTIYRGSKFRTLLLPRIGKKAMVLNLQVHRLGCKSCGSVRWPKLPFAQGKQRYTNAFALFALDLLQLGTVKSVATFLSVGWDMIKSIHKRKLSSLYKNIDLKAVRYIAIDEFMNSKKNEKKFMTIVINLETGRIIHAIEGKGKDDVMPFLRKLAKKAKELKAVSMDMGKAYFSAVTEALHDVDIVFDHFHVTKLMNDALNDFRKELQSKLDKEGIKTLKGSRYLILVNLKDLASDRQKKLDSILQANEPLFVIYSMKEQLRLFWEFQDKKSARDFLMDWCNTAIESNIAQLTKVANTLLSRSTGLLNFFKHRISSGKIEGVINKIKTLKRQVYGFRDSSYFKLRLYHLHAQKYSLTG